MLIELKMDNRSMKSCFSFIRNVWPILAFIMPVMLLYVSNPGSFEGDATWVGSWQGRFFYIFFLWLLALETILDWETLGKTRISRTNSTKTVALTAASLSPTVYTIVTTFLGGNNAIVNLATAQGVAGADRVFLSIEYFAFAILFSVIVLLMYGTHGFQNYSISGFFLCIVGTLYLVDDVYPFGAFTPFQLIVPTTAYLAAGALNLMGYHTLWLGNQGGMPTYIAWDAHGNYSVPFSIAWPCAGVESLLIYTAVILLFLRRSAIPLWHKAAYFVIGAIVTYFINILRIVSIYLTSINHGDWIRFHNIIGPLYSISWIISYPLIIIGSQLLWSRIKIRKEPRKQVEQKLSQRGFDSLG